MNDTVLLMTGIAVFGLMLIGIVLTVAEFGQAQRNDESTPHEHSDLSATSDRSKPDHRG